MSDLYQPSFKMLENYAKVLVNFALNSGAGVKSGEVVELIVPDLAKPLGKELHKAIIKAGAHPLLRFIPTGFEEDYLSLASPEQLDFFPREFMKAKAELITHRLVIGAEETQLDSPQQIRNRQRMRQAGEPYVEWLRQKENEGKYTWTYALWGTPELAKTVGLTLEEYWQQIAQACFLNEADPVATWRASHARIEELKQRLNALKIEKLHVEGADADLWIQLGKGRLWVGGSGRNIPSFEIFTSPDWRGTEGWIRLSQPLYRFGAVIEGIELRFEKGVLVEASAKKGEESLKAILATKGMDKIGEYSLTDRRLSKISHVMATTLFDENFGGEFGNTHIALGRAYSDTYDGNLETVKWAELEKLGYNASSDHVDVISTTDRQVTAYLPDGSQKIIYKSGEFLI